MSITEKLNNLYKNIDEVCVDMVDTVDEIDRKDVELILRSMSALHITLSHYYEGKRINTLWEIARSMQFKSENACKEAGAFD